MRGRQRPFAGYLTAFPTQGEQLSTNKKKTIYEAYKRQVLF